MDPCLQKLQHEIAAAIAQLPAEHLRWHRPGKWCAAEILEHLYLTYTGTTKGFSRVVEAGKPRTTPSTWAQRGRQLIVLGVGYLPSGREAPAMARPPGLPSEKVLAEIGQKIAEMDDMIQRCQEQFGKRTQLLDHPILGSLSAAQWRKFHLVHGRHHLQQIRRLRQESGPSPSPPPQV